MCDDFICVMDTDPLQERGVTAHDIMLLSAIDQRHQFGGGVASVHKIEWI